MPKQEKNSEALVALTRRVVEGDQAAVSRALSIVIDEKPGFEELSKYFFEFSGRAHKIGFCGPPGSGKSSLIGTLLSHFRRRDTSKGPRERLGVLAVDPTSPYTGGAFLGDRLRLQSHALDPEIFIRSLASRGMLGGLTSNIFGAVHVLEAYGCEKIFIETVGSGQGEVEIAKVADTIVYVTAPSLGDDIQAMKAGTMEIADIFVVNKSDMAEKDKALADLRTALGLVESSGDWVPKIVATSIKLQQGIEELAKNILEHRAYLAQSSEGRRRVKGQVLEELSLYISKRVYRHAQQKISERHVDLMLAKKTDPVTLGNKILQAK
ncbi:MAG: methylmalonyl Co-A mutase-associated GTPase MeaB [Elusimicrobia bacterium]|nr:methylmalonyl Co-A mutase-associated GTPase MeaB [Elusimicrobiota bacterium]